jgi:hypothetical protein
MYVETAVMRVGPDNWVLWDLHSGVMRHFGARHVLRWQNNDTNYETFILFSK